MKVSDRLVERARGMLAQCVGKMPAIHRPFDVDWNKIHPPGAIPKGNSGLAMDSAVTDFTGWAQDSYAMALNSAFAEGQEFLGYPYLAVLAQRPEYRTIVETLATESMRKGYKLEVEEGSGRER